MTTNNEVSRLITEARDGRSAGRIYAENGDLMSATIMMHSAGISAQLAIATAIAGVQLPPEFTIDDTLRTETGSVIAQAFDDYPAGHHLGRWEFVAQRALEFIIRQSRTSPTEGDLS